MNVERLRWPWVVWCVAFSALMLMGGWLIPIHMHAVDASVLERAGEGHLSLMDRGRALAQAGSLDAARLIFQAAQAEKTGGAKELAGLASGHSESRELFPGGPKVEISAPVTTLVIKSGNREALLAYLKAAGSPAVTELLHARELTNTVIFTPSASSSGQAIDAAISICGLLLANHDLSPGLQDAVLQRTTAAITHPDAQPLEEILVDLMSLGQRLNWGQLAAFVGGINDPASLNILAESARNAGSQLPELFSAVLLSQQPDQVANYLKDFSQSGLDDLSATLRQGEGGLDELLSRHERIYHAPPRPSWAPAWFVQFATNTALRTPGFALMFKWFFYIASGILLAAAAHVARSPRPRAGEPVRARGFYGIRELLFGLGFLLVVLLLSEPFLAPENQKTEFVFRLRLPSAGVASPVSTTQTKTKLMDTRSLFTLALFFVLQGLIYSACLAKLREIRAQKVPARVQIKLLENEEHLFDGGLYLGFAGTIVCLILVSLGVIQQSLMAAYSSTSFGIIFVSIFKIFNLRPVRRRLVMLAEEQTTVPAQPAPAPARESLAIS